MLLAERLIGTLDSLSKRREITGMKAGLFGASTGAAAALLAAAQRRDIVAAVVSRGGRPDLAWESLAQVLAPTLLIVGELDREVIELNKRAYRQLQSTRRLEVIAGASHLFEEPGTLETVGDLASQWFARYLSAGAQQAEVNYQSSRQRENTASCRTRGR